MEQRLPLPCDSKLVMANHLPAGIVLRPVANNNEAIPSFLVKGISGSLGENLDHLPMAAEIMGVIHLEHSEDKRLDTFAPRLKVWC